MPKHKQKKTRKIVDPIADEKIRKLDVLMKAFEEQCAAYETYLQTTCDRKNEEIDKLYRDKLASIPEKIRNMMIEEVLKVQENERMRQTECPKDENAIRSMFERIKTTEKKKTHKKERKRSISASASNRPLPINRPPSNAFQRISRTISEPSMCSPLGKLSRVPNNCVTPKFNPSLPVSKMARKPKPGEILMSLSGSPLQNFVNDTKITLSLGQGKVLTFDDEAIVEKDLVKEIDEPMKNMLKNVRQKLDEIIKS